jgi:integrase
MGTVNLVLDKRVEKSGGKYNLSIRVCYQGKTMFIPLSKLSEDEHERIIVKKSMKPEHINFRTELNGYVEKAEKVMGRIQHFTPARFRKQYKDELGKKEVSNDSLLLKDLFQRYIDQNITKVKTREHYINAGRAFEYYQPGISIWDITPQFLREFQRDRLKVNSQPTIDGYNRDLRAVINYFTDREKIIPQSYEYPFGKGKYIIGDNTPKKLVLREDEIEKVVRYNDFKSERQKYALTVWKTLYYAGGMNIADLTALTEKQVQKLQMEYIRIKTQDSKSKNKQITVPMNDRLAGLLDELRKFRKTKIDGIRFQEDSNTIMGLLPEAYSEQRHKNMLRRLRVVMKEELKTISEELGLSVQLQMKSARDCFGTTLFRAGESLEVIGYFLGHSSVLTTARYIGSLGFERESDAFGKLVV